MIQEFISEQFGMIRTFEEDGEIYFLGTDVANALKYSDKNKAVRMHTAESDRKALKYKVYAKSSETEIKTLWGNNDFRDKVFVNESGLYCMIFGSELESAEEFKLWVTRVVLPSIRKHGGYISGQEDLSAADLEKLQKNIRKLSEDVQKYKKRWHASNAKKEAYRLKSAKRRKEIKSLNEVAATFEKYYFDLIADFEALKSQNALLKNRLNPVKRSDDAVKTTVKVDRYGFVV